MKHARCLEFTVLLFALESLGTWFDPAGAQSGPPATAVRPVSETLHGVTVTDPYRWMENGGDEFTNWLKAQDAYTRSFLDRIPGREKVLAELRALTTDATTVTRVRRSGGRYFYMKRNAGERVAALYVREMVSGPERRLLEPSDIGSGSTPFTIIDFAVSPDGRYVAVLAAPGGTVVGSLRIVDVADGRMLADRIERALGLDSWRSDGRAFTYLGQRELPDGAAAPDPLVCATTYLHVVESRPAPDKPLIGCGISPRVPMTDTQFGAVSFFATSPHALAWVAVNPAASVLALYTAPADAVTGPDAPWRPLARAEDEVAEAVLAGDTAYLLTSRNAPRRQIVRTPIERPDPSHAALVVPESESVIAAPFSLTTFFSNAMYLAKDALYVRVRDAAVSKLLRVPFGTTTGTETLDLPFEGQLYGLGATATEEGLVFALQSWTRAPRVYSFEPRRNHFTDLALTPRHPAERDGFDARQVTVVSADGTRVPMTLIGANDLRRDGTHPTRVSAYGAYGLVPEPTFRPSLVPWFERGGVDAFCHARGGGEYGEAWHRAGQKENKPNTIADFIACAEYLVAERYTRRARLMGFGGSAGGLAIGGAITKRPDLFTVALPTVAVADLLRMEFSPVGPPNIPEFGTVKDAADFRAMLAVSPYEHIVKGTAYPAVLASTAINDTSVPVWQPAKLVARLQAATASGKPVLLRVDWGSGHSGGTTTSDQEAELADMYSFVLWQMGVPEFQPRAASP